MGRLSGMLGHAELMIRQRPVCLQEEASKKMRDF
jgi:hypothetical protein